MKHSNMTILIHLLTIQCLFYLCVSGSYDFFYVLCTNVAGFVLRQKEQLLLPNYRKASCKFQHSWLMAPFQQRFLPFKLQLSQPLQRSQDLRSNEQTARELANINLPQKEWEKHGTCSESVLDQHRYFEAALNIKNKVDLLKILQDAEIHPDGKFYSLEAIKDALKGGSGYVPGVECNRDASGNYQLFQIYLCVDTSGSDLIDCPVVLKRKCNSTIEFPPF